MQCCVMEGPIELLFAKVKNASSRIGIFPTKIEFFGLRGHYLWSSVNSWHSLLFQA